MEHKATIASLFLAGLTLFAIGAAAQHDQHHPPRTTPKAESMMAEGMIAHHQEMEKLLGQLLQRFDSHEEQAGRAPRAARTVAKQDQAAVRDDAENEWPHEALSHDEFQTQGGVDRSQTKLAIR